MNGTDDYFLGIRYTLVNFTRLVLMLILTSVVWGIHVTMLTSLCIAGTAFALLWLLLEELRIIRMDANPSLAYIPTGFDVLMVTIFVYITGTINSSGIVGYLYITAIGSLSIRTHQGLYAAGLSIFSFMALALLVYIGILPAIDIFEGGGQLTLYNLVVSSIFFTIIIISTYVVITELRTTNVKLYRELGKEKEKSEILLYNLLPEVVANELKTSGSYAPVRIGSASVMFIDFTGFTRIAESMEPEKLVEKLDRYFSEFDKIVKKHNIEKLKTMGDGYMCAGGVSVPDEDHIRDICAAALEISDHVGRDAGGWSVRIGIHAGPVVAGVIGRFGYSYDIWGDTVNTAIRYEQSAEPGEILVSDIVYENVKESFDLEYRGTVPMKGKGEPKIYLLKKGLKTLQGD